MARPKRKSAFRQFLYDFRYRCGEYALRGFIDFLPYVPQWSILAFTRLMAWLTFVVLWKYRKRMEENVATVLGTEIPDPQTRKALVWRAWLNFARGVVDTTTVMHFSQAKIKSAVTLEGEQYIRNALERGKGVLSLSAHLGSFTLIGARLAASGFPFSAVIKHPANERFARLTDEYREQVGVHTIPAKPRREAVRGILKALRENRIVLVIADEFKSGDALVDFFGMKVPAPRGPATLALRTGAVTLPMFATRRADDSIVLKVGAPIAPVERADLEESVSATTAVYTRYLEAAIREFPDQWNWLGLPRRDGKMSRAEMARAWRESRKAQAATQSSTPAESDTSSP
jgi:Kdo2-lipid IVA lauroyltransferase/acyltransferase